MQQHEKNSLFSLLMLRFRVSFFNLLEEFRVWCWYYRKNFSFMKADWALRSQYLFRSPFGISKEFLRSCGEKEIYAYGETPLTALEEIAQQARVGPEDLVFELGSGRGRSLFWLALFRGCRSVGVERIPFFVQKARKTQQRYPDAKVEILQGDFLETALQRATVVYLYGTSFSDETLRALACKCEEELQDDAKIISVSFPLGEYGSRPDDFRLVKSFPVTFPWGEATVYLEEMRKAPSGQAR